ncbi:MAG: Bifunctional uridylyltransferase/uridylyl-removing enzyme [Sodalis sp.]|nr:MAG: Bifunctional uridylyltransferase/uridylyl-removing enzyme [Sodalis sp.]
MQILHQSSTVKHAILPMHRHSVLWTYMPQWSNIVVRYNLNMPFGYG